MQRFGMKQCKNFLIFIIVLMIIVCSNTAVSFAEEIGQEKAEDTNARIEIENLQELEKTVYEYPIGTTEEEIKVTLPEKVIGYDADGGEYEITVSWEIEGEYSPDSPGYLCGG